MEVNFQIYHYWRSPCAMKGVNMRKMKKFVTAVLLTGMLAGLCACSGGESGGGSDAKSSGGDSAAGNSGKKICCLLQANNTFMASLREAVEAEAKTQGVSVDIFNADNDINMQLDQIESAVANQYDAIILVAVDSEGVAPGARSIMDAGIPLVCMNLKVSDESLYDVYVGSDDVDAGTILGEWAREATGGECKIGWLHVPMGCTAQIGRTQGITETLIDVCEGAEVVAEDDGQAQMDEGMRITEDWLQTYPEIDIIIAENDSMGLGAMQAVLAAGKKDEILICGVDGDQAAVQAIIDGTYDMTVFQNAEGQGTTAVEVAVGLINGESYDKEIVIPFEPITAENAEDYLE